MYNSNQLDDNRYVKLPFKLYKSCGLNILKIAKEREGAEYNAHKMIINNLNTMYRVGKITPTKVGLFVTLWKRINGKTTPYTNFDNIHLVIIDTSIENNEGQFIFPKDILIKKGILSNQGKVGKMAFRVYPPWSTPTNKQAINTQKWQLDYYVSYDDFKTSHFIKETFKI